MNGETGTLRIAGRDLAFTVARSPRRRRTIAFTLEPGMVLRVLAPARASFLSIQTLLHDRRGWIAQRLQAYEMMPLPRRFEEGEMIRYLGHDCRLRITRDAGMPQGCILRPRRFEVNIPDLALTGAALGEEVQVELRLWLKRRARVFFQKRMDLWAARLGLRYRRLAVSSPQRQWGSCSVDNIIRLNWRLINAPLSLLDYVVVHELCHVAQKNHSQRFWRLVASVMPDYQARRKELRRIGPGLGV